MNIWKKLLLYIFPALAIGSYGLFLVTFLIAFFNGGYFIIDLNKVSEKWFELILGFAFLILLLISYALYIKVIVEYQQLKESNK